MICDYGEAGSPVYVEEQLIRIDADHVTLERTGRTTAEEPHILTTELERIPG